MIFLISWYLACSNAGQFKDRQHLLSLFLRKWCPHQVHLDTLTVRISTSACTACILNTLRQSLFPKDKQPVPSTSEHVCILTQ